MKIKFRLRVQGVAEDFWTVPYSSMVSSHSGKLGNEIVDALAMLGFLFEVGLLVGADPPDISTTCCEQ